MLINIFTKTMTMKANKIITALITIIFISGCSLSPGMHMSFSERSGEGYVYIESIDKDIRVKDISAADLELLSRKNNNYKIGKGDQIAITVWGLNEVFPIINVSPDSNLRRVDSNGNIFFPYVGTVQAAGKTQDELRESITSELSKYFNDPQLDVSIARFNSQKVYMLGEVNMPIKINISDVPLSLSDALGESKGLNNNTSSGSEVFVIRQGEDNQNPVIYRADLNSPSGFLVSGSFYLENNDIVYVNAKGTARWNRVISQFFPFSSFLNSIDNLTNSD